MLEKRVKEISKILGEENMETFYILSSGRGNRGIYFQNNSRSKRFIGIKFRSPLENFRLLKQIAYLLIRWGFLQIFLKKVRLSSKLGDVIFVAEQIKCFDLKNKFVFSYTRKHSKDKEMIGFKKIQRDLAKKEFAPRILDINETTPSSKEELLRSYGGGMDKAVFQKLLLFYKLNQSKTISLKEYISFLHKKLEKTDLDRHFFNDVFNRISSYYPDSTKLRIVHVHGDFAKEQVLLKDNSFVFIDWHVEEDIMARDLIKFFREETDLIDNEEFKDILEIFPLDVRENIKLYIALHEVYSSIRKKSISDFSKKRIKNVLN